MDMKRDLDFLKRVAKGVAENFGRNCEVVIHDLSKDYDHTIVVIENGHVTGRQVGGGSSEVVLKVLKDGSKSQDHYNYVTKTTGGKILKSTTILLRDERENVIGLFCINLDMTDFLLGEAALRSIMPKEERPDNSGVVDTIPSDVNELLDILIEEACSLVGKPATIMNKTDKVRAIQYLNQKGAFLIKKSGDRVADYLGISKYTLYNYLGFDQPDE